MIRQILSLLQLFTLLSPTSAIPHEKRQGNETQPILTERRTLDELVSSRLRSIERLHPSTPFRLRGVQAEPYTTSPSIGATVLVNLTIQLYDVNAAKFVYTTNIGERPGSWSDLIDSFDQDWGELEPWEWSEKTFRVRDFLDYIRMNLPGTKLQLIWLEKLTIDDKRGSELYWMCMPEEGRKIFWVGDQTGKIYDDVVPVPMGLSQTSGSDLVNGNSAALIRGIKPPKPKSPHVDDSSWTELRLNTSDSNQSADMASVLAY